MRSLPKDQDNWCGWHVDVRIDRAKELFEQYESRVNFDLPKEKIDSLYRPYQLMRQEAIDVARAVNWRVSEAESLP